ncbi:MAG: hypothetical protein M3362_14110 [Acidobacteriota bacterium]|nr:hypothetical protein [Acidobacteriota bacterium]
MRHLRSKLIPSVVALILCVGSNLNLIRAQSAAPAQVTQHYTMVDLTPAGATTAQATGISATGQVGYAGFPSPTSPGVIENHAMLWFGNAASMADLGVGAIYEAADGQQVGTAFNHAALWSGSANSFVDLNPANWQSSIAYGVAGGQQVGQATTTTPCGEKKGACPSGGSISFHPFMWTGSAQSAVDVTPFALGFGAGGMLGTDGVQQVGYVQQSFGFNAFGAQYAVLWTGTPDSAINLNPANSLESQAKAVAHGQQVGYAYSPHHAVLWTGSAASVVDLHPAGYFSSEANATNGVQQVGSGMLPTPNSVLRSHALVWSGSAASAIDLNQFMPLGFTDAAATGIDAAGNIVGWASSRLNSPGVHAVMWVPSDPAASFAQSMSVSPSIITAGDSALATVTLSQPAPAGGAVVNLASIIYSGAAANSLTISMPSSVIIAEGTTSASFTVSTGVTSLTGFTSSIGVDIQAAYGDTIETTTLAVNPPLSLNTFSVAPGNLTGGSTATGTVILSGAAPAGGAVVALSSNNATATVPASVLVPAGQTFATFTVQTNPVTAFTNVTLSATYGSAIAVTRTASILVAPPPVQVDTVAIQKADYVVSKKQLVVQASSTSQTAMLTVSVTATGEVIGILTNKGAGSYAGTFNLASNPQNITVTSDLSGTGSRAVTLK